jgi:predicted GNAT family N-acyltransferase
MTFQVIPHDSAEYRETIALRDAILRAPLGLSFSEEELRAEATQVHVTATGDGGALAGCLVLRPSDDRSVHMRQLAVVEAARRSGLGSGLVRFAEDHARTALGAQRIHCHARADVVPFYEQLGYAKVGEPFIEVTIPHQAMEKRL